MHRKGRETDDLAVRRRGQTKKRDRGVWVVGSLPVSVTIPPASQKRSEKGRA